MTKIKKKFIAFVKSKYDNITLIISSIISILLYILENFVYEKITKNNDKSVSNDYIQITLWIFLIALIIILCLLSSWIKKQLFKDDKYDEFIQKAYFEIQQLSLECQSMFQDICLCNNNESSIVDWIMKCSQLTVDKCYRFFCSSFDTGYNLVDDLKFEVTFMTRSYIDNEITIPFSCNKEHRTPTSMLLRGDNPKIYENTITAEIYNEYAESRKPTFHIIPNTSQNKEGTAYKFLYKKQEERIKSSIVLPVLSHKSELLGTLVVHCNCYDFFKTENYNFWYEIMQAFASEMGKYKLMLDYFIDDSMPKPY